MKNKVDSMSKIGGYASYNVGFQKNIYEKAKAKKLAKEYKEFLEIAEFNTYEEVMLQGFVISYINLNPKFLPKLSR